MESGVKAILDAWNINERQAEIVGKLMAIDKLDDLHIDVASSSVPSVNAMKDGHNVQKSVILLRGESPAQDNWRNPMKALFEQNGLGKYSVRYDCSVPDGKEFTAWYDANEPGSDNGRDYGVTIVIYGK